MTFAGAPAAASDIDSIVVILRTLRTLHSSLPAARSIQPGASRKQQSRARRGVSGRFEGVAKSQKYLGKARLRSIFAQDLGNLFRRATAAVRRLARRVRLEPTVEDGSAWRRESPPVGRAIDDRGCAQPAMLAVADIDRRDPDRRRLQNTARRIAHYCVRQPKCCPVAFAAERGKQMRPVCPLRDERPDRVVYHVVAGIGVDTGENDSSILDFCQRAQKSCDVCASASGRAVVGCRVTSRNASRGRECRVHETIPAGLNRLARRPPRPGRAHRQLKTNSGFSPIWMTRRR